MNIILLVINPILIIGFFIALFWIYKKNNTSYKKQIYFLNMYLIFFLISILTIFYEEKVENLLKSNNNSILYIISAFFLSYFFFVAIFRICLLSWFNKNTSPKFWYVILLILITILYALLFNDNIYILTISSILLGFIISILTIIYLNYIDLYYKNTNFMSSTIIIGILMTLSILTANMYNLTITYLYVTNTIKLLIILPILLLTYLLTYCYKNKKEIAIQYELKLKENLIKYDNKIMIYLVCFSTIITILNGMFDLPLLKIYIYSEFKNIFNNRLLYEQIENIVFISLQLIISYLIYKFLFRKLNIKNSLILLNIILLIITFISVYVHNPILLMFNNFVFNILFFLTYYSIFSLSIMWQCRSKNKPVVFSFLFTYTLIKAIFTIVFNIIKMKYLNTNHIWNADITLHIIYTIIFILIIINISIIIIYFEKILGEYNSIKNTKIIWLNLIKDEFELKAKRKLNI